MPSPVCGRYGKWHASWECLEGIDNADSRNIYDGIVRKIKEWSLPECRELRVGAKVS